MYNTWATRNGEEIPIKALEDDHLINIIKFCYRQAPQMRRQLEKIASQGYIRCTDDDDIIQMFVPGFSELLDEMAIRGLAGRVHNL